MAAAQGWYYFQVEARKCTAVAWLPYKDVGDTSTRKTTNEILYSWPDPVGESRQSVSKETNFEMGK